MARASAIFVDLERRCREEPDLAPLAEVLTHPNVQVLLRGTFAASPFLTSLIERYPAALRDALLTSPEDRFHTLRATAAAVANAPSTAEAMRGLRLFKSEVALLTALCDLGGVWPVMTVARVLSEAADAAVSAAVTFLFAQARAKGDWLASGEQGYFVLAMGKHGAMELNYSSDIDLIVFYELGKLELREGLEPRRFLVRLTRDLVQLLHERTEHGYVFRTDLRLRPDPGSTPLAISTEAALNYYESVGQNWERAALIKARPIAGDIETGRSFLSELAPFIWRKYLDFAAIADIHAMKRQIHAFRGFGEIAVAGHDIKVGRGGIREIEFFVQTQQLIAGGRQPELRVSQTLIGLERLETRGWITLRVRQELDAAYRFLRTVEHRLQMVADEQTQTLPVEADKLASLARFCGFDDTAAFAARLTVELQRVQAHYVNLFEDSPELSRHGANMVFAGEADDPGTIEALSALGYKRPEAVIEAVRGWHHGRYPAVRTPRARELLTEVQPALIDALARTADPDQAFLGFDRFLSELPSSVQLFSLLKQHPGLLELMAAIMGTAPRLARTLSKRRRVLDAVLAPGFFGSLPSDKDVTSVVAAEIASASDFQEALDNARLVGNEQAFLIGVRVLTDTISAAHAGGAYAHLAERLISAMQSVVERDLARTNGRVAGAGAVTIAMGKLGGREMTAASDLDLIVIYDFDPAAQASDGLKPLPPTQYYTRFTQRLISALSSQTAEGNLYDVDMRLRPSGQKGPVATQLSSFIEYQRREAWTWEHMALTRARVITGPPELRASVETAIRDILTLARDRARTAADVRDMRQRIEKEKGTQDIWDLKQVRGGLVDLEFIAQYLQLIHAHKHPKVLNTNTVAALANLQQSGLLSAAAGEVLLPAARLLNNLTQILRLCVEGTFSPQTASEGLRALLSRAGEAPSFSSLEADLRARQASVHGLFETLIA